MERMELSVTNREIGKTVSKKLRREGAVPAILYGVNREPLALAVNRRDLDRVTNTKAGWNILLDLNLDGKEKVLSRITDYQAEVLTRELTHVDFQVLDLKKKMKTEVPLRFVGKAIGVKNGGILEITTRTLEIRCLPTLIPEYVDVDVSALDMGDNIHVNDLGLPEGVECLHETNFSIATVSQPTEELVADLTVAGAVEGEAGAAATAEGEAATAAAPAEGEAKKGADAGKAPAKAPAKGKE